MAFAYTWKHSAHSRLLRSEVQAWWTFFFISLFENVNEVLSLLVSGVKLLPSFDKFYLATSVAEFWGKRWNRVMQVMLNETVYEPILQRRLVIDHQYHYKGQIPTTRRIIGAVCVFVISGFAHVWLFMFILRLNTFPTVFYFYFTLNGAVVLFERLLKYCVSRSAVLTSFVSNIPKFIFIVVTHINLVVLLHYFLFPTMISAGFVDNAADGCLAILG